MQTHLYAMRLLDGQDFIADALPCVACTASPYRCQCKPKDLTIFC